MTIHEACKYLALERPDGSVAVCRGETFASLVEHFDRTPGLGTGLGAMLLCSRIPVGEVRLCIGQSTVNGEDRTPVRVIQVFRQETEGGDA